MYSWFGHGSSARAGSIARLFASFTLFLSAHGSATANPASILNDFLEDTRIVGIVEIDPHRDLLAQARGGGFELSGGQFVSFDRWYRRLNPDLRLDFMTRITNETALLWGFSTGERGKKYSVAPSFRVGILAQIYPSPLSTLSLTVTTAFGGALREKSCVADFGSIGGIQEVNCRLAASIIEPKRTLDFLWREKMPDQSRVTLRYQLRF